MINSHGWDLMYKWLVIKLQWKTVETWHFLDCYWDSVKLKSVAKRETTILGNKREPFLLSLWDSVWSERVKVINGSVYIMECRQFSRVASSFLWSIVTTVRMSGEILHKQICFISFKLIYIFKDLKQKHH